MHTHYYSPRLFRLLVAILALPLLQACVTPIGSTELVAQPQVIESISRYKRVYTVQAGDLVEVYVHRQPDYSKKGTIRPDGYLTLPVLDELKVIGLTPREIDDLVTRKLSSRLKNPEVTVFVENVIEPMVYVIGDVGQATPIPLRNAKTLAQAFTQVAGILRTGDMENIAVIRLHEDGKLRANTLDEKGLGQSGLLLAMQNTPLLPEDLVFVPEGGRSQFNRAVQDFVTAPFGAINQILSPYLQYRLIETIEDD